MLVRFLFGYVKSKLLSLKRHRMWKERNLHNTTDCVDSEFPLEQVTVGKGTYGGVNALIFSDTLRLSIGSYCSIAPDVSFIAGADHSMSFVSTFPYRVKVMGEKYEAVSKGNIIIDDDVWIGYGATILSGVHISQGAVVAAGAVVSRDVPPYAIVGGIPAKVIKYRFNPQVIRYLLTLDYSKLTEDLIRQHIDDLYTEIDSLEDVEKLYAWFPKKEIMRG